jgi:hypothetical protein
LTGSSRSWTPFRASLQCPEVIAERYQGLGLSLRAYRPSHEELEVDSNRLAGLIAKELGRA